MRDEISKQQQIKNIIMEFLNDGCVRTVLEIKNELERKGIVLDKKNSALRNALYNLKQEDNSLQNPNKGEYCYIAKKISIDNELKFGFRFEEFEIVKPCTRKSAKLVVTILPDGTFSLNSQILKKISDLKVGVFLKKDCSQLLLMLESKNPIILGKNGRAKNYDIQEKLLKSKIKLPTYFVGKWHESHLMWIGDRTNINPNRGQGKRE